MWGGRFCCHLHDGKPDVTSQPGVTLADSPNFTQILWQHHRELGLTPEVLLSEQGWNSKSFFFLKFLDISCFPPPAPSTDLSSQGFLPLAQLCSTNTINPCSASEYLAQPDNETPWPGNNLQVTIPVALWGHLGLLQLQAVFNPVVGCITETQFVVHHALGNIIILKKFRKYIPEVHRGSCCLAEQESSTSRPQFSISHRRCARGRNDWPVLTSATEVFQQ